MNNDNLRALSREEAVKNGKKGGIASGKARRERKALKEQLLLLLDNEDTQKELCTALISQAMTGNTKAFEVIRDTIGEKPVNKEENEVNMKYNVIPCIQIDGKELEFNIGEPVEDNLYKKLHHKDKEDEF